MKAAWRRVTREGPCPICGKPDWCGVSADGSAAVCMRVESPTVTRNGGWLHRTSTGTTAVPLPMPDLPPAAGTDLARLWREWLGTTDALDLGRLAAQLGVASVALRALGAAWAPPHRAWAFPMRDDRGGIVGIRLRAEGGRKWAVRGGHEGLFVPAPFAGRELTICEGPTDTAAALSLGLPAIGRPSCAGAVAATVAFIRARKVVRVVLVADRDRPGREGAARLARALPVPHALVTPPAKDLREWVARGATRAAFDTLLRHAIWRAP